MSAGDSGDSAAPLKILNRGAEYFRQRVLRTRADPDLVKKQRRSAVELLEETKNLYVKTEHVRDTKQLPKRAEDLQVRSRLSCVEPHQSSDVTSTAARHRAVSWPCHPETEQEGEPTLCALRPLTSDPRYRAVSAPSQPNTLCSEAEFPHRPADPLPDQTTQNLDLKHASKPTQRTHWEEPPQNPNKSGTPPPETHTKPTRKAPPLEAPLKQHSRVLDESTAQNILTQTHQGTLSLSADPPQTLPKPKSCVHSDNPSTCRSVHANNQHSDGQNGHSEPPPTDGHNGQSRTPPPTLPKSKPFKAAGCERGRSPDTLPESTCDTDLATVCHTPPQTLPKPRKKPRTNSVEDNYDDDPPCVASHDPPGVHSYALPDTPSSLMEYIAKPNSQCITKHKHLSQQQPASPILQRCGNTDKNLKTLHSSPHPLQRDAANTVCVQSHNLVSSPRLHGDSPTRLHADSPPRLMPSCVEAWRDTRTETRSDAGSSGTGQDSAARGTADGVAAVRRRVKRTGLRGSLSDLSKRLSGSSEMSDNARISRNSADIERFFNDMGLERCVLDGMLAGSTPLSLSTADLALLDSSSLASARSLCSDTDEQDFAPLSTTTGAPALIGTGGTGTSIVERNARIIKWLCGVKKANSHEEEA